MRPSKYKKQKVPTFINKLHTMLNDQKCLSIIQWTQEKDAFIILDLFNFTENILPCYFKHSNYSSFIRQLNMYNFTKKRQDGRLGEDQHIYQHENFVKNNQQKLKQIKRKQISQHIVSSPQMPLMSKNTNQTNSDCIIKPNQQQNEQADTSLNKITLLQDKISTMRTKQQKLKTIIYNMIHQNQILIEQNKDLGRRIKKQSRRKDRIIDQVFRIVAQSITEFWSQFYGDGLDDQNQSLQELFQLLVGFIENHEMEFILKALDLFLMKNDEKKVQIFNIMSQSQENLFHADNVDVVDHEKEINQFMRDSTILLKTTK